MHDRPIYCLVLDKVPPPPKKNIVTLAESRNCRFDFVYISAMSTVWLDYWSIVLDDTETSLSEDGVVITVIRILFGFLNFSTIVSVFDGDIMCMSSSRLL